MAQSLFSFRRKSELSVKTKRLTVIRKSFSEEIFFLYLGFLSRPFANHRTAGERGGHFFNSSLPLPPDSQTLRHQPSDYCREPTSAHRQKPDSSTKSVKGNRFHCLFSIENESEKQTALVSNFFESKINVKMSRSWKASFRSSHRRCSI